MLDGVQRELRHDGGYARKGDMALQKERFVLLLVTEQQRTIV